MAIQYYMRGYNTAAPGAVGYVDWVVNDEPDSTASFVPSPYSSVNIINITVNKVVTSKVGNFLNPSAEPSFISPNYTNPVDGYFLHLNSYDWLNPSPPDLTESLPSLTQPIGVAVVRGTSNGTTLNPYATLYWEEGLQQWAFNQINHDGSIGSSENVLTGNLFVNGHGYVDGYLFVDGYLAVTDSLTDPWALTGLVRLPNNQAIKARDSSNSTDVTLVTLDAAAGGNNVILGDFNHNVIIGGDASNVIGNPSVYTTTVAGDLIVLGSTTTVESVIVDIVGRVIHGNWSTSSPVSPPTLIAGYSVHRGATGGLQNDGAAWIWTEGTQVSSGADGYWRAATILHDGYSTSPPDNYTISSSPNGLSVMASSFAAVSTSTMQMTGAQLASSGVLPGVGGLRVQNNTTAVSARNVAANNDLLLLGTDASNHILHGGASSPQNAGQIFNTTTASLYDFQVNSVSEVQISSDGNGPFVRESSTTFTPAVSGFIRVPNATPAVAARNVGNTQDLYLVGTDNLNHILIGEFPTPQNAGIRLGTTTGNVVDVFINDSSEVQLGSDGNGPFVRESSSTFIPATTGFVRVPANVTAVSARSSANTNDHLLLGTDGADHILHGGSASPNNSGHIFSTITGAIFDFWINGASTLSIGANEINFAEADGYATITQVPTYAANVTGATMTVAAQSSMGALGMGGNLVLSSGTGSIIDGYVDLQVGGTTVAAAEPNKFTFLQGRRRHVTYMGSMEDGYDGYVAASNDLIAIADLDGYLNIHLPAFPALGDAYQIKDTTGLAGVYPVYVYGNGYLIDGFSVIDSYSFVPNFPGAFFDIEVTFTGTSWSIT